MLDHGMELLLFIPILKLLLVILSFIVKFVSN